MAPSSKYVRVRQENYKEPTYFVAVWRALFTSHSHYWIVGGVAGIAFVFVALNGINYIATHAARHGLSGFGAPGVWVSDDRTEIDFTGPIT